ncbi:MAG: restriction endonuclease [Chloroflexi bacterium]|nr:restriction endonuclease [Chloroflexota bacterium]MDL1943214.1 restriction endonuclease [Chloroflexi bacterium CFX2]
MTIPDYQSLMLPLIKLAADRKEHSLQESTQIIAQELKLSEADLAELLPSGRKTRFYDRIGWAVTYLRKAGLFSSPGRGKFQITQRGLDVLKNPPARINVEFLEQYDEFVEFRARRDKSNDEIPIAEKLEIQTPEEAIEAAYQNLRQTLVDEVLQTVKGCSPAFFERLVIDVLVKMGYGGTRKDAGKAIGRSGDGGIDGIINEDRLGLDVIYIQAKKWENPVGRPEIQKFAGALQGQRAKKGIFITTSTFTNEAKEFASRIDSKITLIDGETLSQLMIDYNVGINSIATYELKRIDSDYFIEE